MHRTAMTKTRLVNWIKDGRGQGVGKDYRPWIQVTRQDHASNGQSSIIPDPFIGRQHHLLSKLERAICISNMAQPCIADIREQYPLWTSPHPNPMLEIRSSTLDTSPDKWPDSHGTLNLAKQLNISHATFVGLKVPYIYTTDQLLTVKFHDQQPFLVAVSVKYWGELRGDLSKEKSKPKRIRARKAKFRKLRLEMEYWRSLGIPWVLATDRHVHPQVSRNLEWAMSGAIQRLTENDVFMLKHFLVAWNEVKWHGRCLDQIKAISTTLNISTNKAVQYLKFAIMRSLIAVDLTRPVHLQLPFPFGETHSPYEIPSWSLLNHIRRFK